MVFSINIPGGKSLLLFSFLLNCSSLAFVVAYFHLCGDRLAQDYYHGEDIHSHAKDKSGCTAATHGDFGLSQQYQFAERNQMVLYAQKTYLVKQL